MRPIVSIHKTAAVIMALSLASLGLVGCGNDQATSTAPSAPSTNDTAQAQPTNEQPVQTTAEAPADQSADVAQTAQAADSKPSAETEADSDAAHADLVARVQALPSGAGESRYQATCHACHAQGLLEAPKLSDQANWQNRLTKGIDVLYQHSIKGFNKMPAQAVGDISDAEVAAAVDYMLVQAGVS